MTILIQVQGKGGVGKSVISVYLMQYLLANNQDVVGFDTDTVNPTFSSFAGLNINRVKLGDRPDEINPRYFDDLMELLLARDSASYAVIDIGASTFLPLLAYMRENDVLSVFATAGHRVRFQSILFGGQPCLETIQNFGQVVSNFAECEVDVWYNEFYNKILVNGKTFEELPIYQKCEGNIRSFIRIAAVPMQTTGHDITQMLAGRLTFDEYINGMNGDNYRFNMMARARISNYKKAIFNEIAYAEFIEKRV